MKILDKSLKLATQLYPSVRFQKAMVFCFIFDGNKLLSIGSNNMKSESAKALRFGKKFGIQKLVKFPFACAETVAISNLWGRRLITGNEKIVVVRLKSLGSTDKERKILVSALSKPCHNCRMILDALGLERVWWSNAEGGFSNE